MFETRQVSAHASGRSISALSVLALLAFACFPLLAHADSSGIQYSDAPPTATGKNTIPTQTEPSAHSSKKNGGGAAHGDKGSNGGRGSGKGSSSKSSGGSGKAAGNGADQQGNPGKAGAEGGSENLSQTAHSGAEPTSQDSGGSSPLVPILIAIAVLAAISIGAVVMRRRRRRGPGSGTPVSPEVG